MEEMRKTLKWSHGSIPDQLCYKAVRHQRPSCRLNGSLTSDVGRPPALMSRWLFNPLNGSHGHPFWRAAPGFNEGCAADLWCGKHPSGTSQTPATHSNLDYQGFKIQFEKERPPSPFYFLTSTWSGTPNGCGLPGRLQARAPCLLHQVTEDVPHVRSPSGSSSGGWSGFKLQSLWGKPKAWR